nr:uclacyanin-3-like [Coffea arabica]
MVPMVFNFTTGAHDVAVVTSKSANDSCNTSAIETTMNTGPTRITLTTPGQHFYICTFPRHCLLGQKLAINVTGTAATPSPTPAPTRPPSGPASAPVPSSISATPPSSSSTPPPSSSPSTSPSGSATPSPSGSPASVSAPPPPNSAPSFAVVLVDCLEFLVLDLASDH